MSEIQIRRKLIFFISPSLPADADVHKISKFFLAEADHEKEREGQNVSRWTVYTETLNLLRSTRQPWL